MTNNSALVKPDKKLDDWTPETYTPVDSTNANTFRRPRQKIWGVFIKSFNGEYVKNNWILVECTNDFKKAKLKAKQFLKYPPDYTDTGNYSGLSSVIVCEIAPADLIVTA